MNTAGTLLSGPSEKVPPRPKKEVVLMEIGQELTLD